MFSFPISVVSVLTRSGSCSLESPSGFWSDWDGYRYLFANWFQKQLWYFSRYSKKFYASVSHSGFITVSLLVQYEFTVNYISIFIKKIGAFYNLQPTNLIKLWCIHTARYNRELLYVSLQTTFTNCYIFSILCFWVISWIFCI